MADAFIYDRWGLYLHGTHCPQFDTDTHYGYVRVMRGKARYGVALRSRSVVVPADLAPRGNRSLPSNHVCLREVA